LPSEHGGARRTFALVMAFFGLAMSAKPALILV
jgi:hypothetical protein